MSEPEYREAREGPFVRVAEGVWVNAAHVCAVVSFQATPDECRVYVSGPSLGGGHILAWNAPVGAAFLAEGLANALDEWEEWRGHQQELGRIRALDSAGEVE